MSDIYLLVWTIIFACVGVASLISAEISRWRIRKHAVKVKAHLDASAKFLAEGKADLHEVMRARGMTPPEPTVDYAAMAAEFKTLR